MSKPSRLVVLAFLLGTGALVAVGPLRGGRDRDRISVETAQVTTGTIARRVMVTGTLAPERTVDVGSQVSGTIASLAADFNQPVSAGQVIARLDPSMYESRLLEAEAKVMQARGEHARLVAILEDARTKLTRAETLATGEVVAQAERDLARTTARQAAADVKGAEAAILAAQAAASEARVNLNHTTIRSPIDGVVINRHVDVGQTVAASVETPVLFAIADLRRMQLLAEVAEADVGGVGPGSIVTFQVESLGDRTFEGTVSAVRLQPVVNESVATSGQSAATPSAAGTAGSAPTTGASTSSRSSPSSASAPSPATTTSGRTSTSQTNGSAQAPAAPAGAASTTTASTTAKPGGVVTYTAVVDVDNVEGAVPPGGTAIITLSGPQRPNVIRIPNNAVTFHPGAETFAAIDQEPPKLEQLEPASSKGKPRVTRQAYVWKFENGRFNPLLVRLGLADDAWTELVNGPVAAGDPLVTSATPRK